MSSPASVTPPGTVTITPPAWVPLDAYVENLRRAAAGVVRVGIGPDGDVLCTGWLITGSLVVIPSYVLDSGYDSLVQCRLPDLDGLPRLDDLTTARVEFVPEAQLATAPDPVRILPALIRLDRDLPDAAQGLHLASPRPAEALLLLHYPMGTTVLQLSQGHLLAVDAEGISHDAQSAPGSSGGPLISTGTGHILGMHWGMTDPTATAHGRAVPLAALLDQLVGAPSWSEIAAHHRLTALGPSTLAPQSVDAVPPPILPPPPGSGPAPPEPALLRAALTWTIDPEALDPGERDAVRPFVADPDASRWSLPADERRGLIHAAGSLEALRSAYRSVADPGPADRALERLVTGPPLDVAEVPEEELPYCLQAISWLDGIVPALPAPAQVNRELQRRRIRSRLRPVATERLWGREAELARLDRWAEQPDPPPLLVTGIGGVGKSALVARFVLDLPDDTVILWLDFDRPDVAPDNAVSVLSALAEQLVVQRDSVVVPTIDASTWPDAARGLGSALTGVRAVMVLDGFEVAQHAERHDELWGVLDAVLDQARGTTRVIVSGRAPVPNLVLGGRRAEPMPLTGLPREAAKRWLIDRGIRTADVLNAVLRMADGLPLLLKMAVRLVETGGDVSDVPRELPRELVDGYLYQRILDRVVDTRLRSLSHDALVLRRITPEVLDAVLADRIPGGVEPEEAIARLTREMALVEALDPSPPGQSGPTTAAAALRLRPEVRVATLRLLEIEDRDRVQQIDRRAADWYVGPGTAAADPEARVAAAAEAVYHYTRAGDVAAARAAWVEGCAAYLQDADRDVPGRFSRARRWLAAQIRQGGEAPGAVDGLGSWESTALRRILDALARGLDRTVPQILEERSDRSPDSPLIVYDAWLARERGDTATGAQMLEDAGEPPGPIGWARRVVAARTAALAGNLRAADALLHLEGAPSQPPDADQGAAVMAARIRLVVDVRSELVITDAFRYTTRKDRAQSYVSYELPAKVRDAVRSTLVPWDFVVAPVRQRLGIEAYVTLPPVPENPQEAVRFAEKLDSLRERLLRTSLPENRRLSGEPVIGPVGPAPAELPTQPPDLVGVLEAGWIADLSVRRWRLVSDGRFPVHVRAVVEGHRFLDQLQLSTAATLATLYPENLQYADGKPLAAILEAAARRAGPAVFDEDALERIQELRPVLEQAARLNPGLIEEWAPTLSQFDMPGPYSWRKLSTEGWTDGTNALVLLAFGPDPLEELERRVLGRPELKAK